MQLPTSSRGRHPKIVSLLDSVPGLRQGALNFLSNTESRLITVQNFQLYLRSKWPQHIKSNGVAHATAVQWLAKLGYFPAKLGKDTYVDGHERADVVEHRTQFIKDMEEFGKFFPQEVADLDLLYNGRPRALGHGKRWTIFCTHDESTFVPRGTLLRGRFSLGGNPILRSKSPGRGIMVSAFLCECHGIICYQKLELGKNFQGYWTNAHLISQLKKDFYSKFKELHPGCDALVAFDQERVDGDFGRKSRQECAAALSQLPEFVAQKEWLAETAEGFSDTTAKFDIIFYPKFHCEFNFIERFWGFAKRLLEQDSDGKFQTMKKNLDQCLRNVPLDSIRKFALKSFRYMSAYRLGGQLTQAHIEYCVKQFKSHRRVRLNFDDWPSNLGSPAALQSENPDIDR
jgi:hypothetical protein